MYEKENKEIVLAGIQLRKKSIDFRTMSDKILTRKKQKNSHFGEIFVSKMAVLVYTEF